MRRSRLVVPAVVVVMLLAGCTGQPGSRSGPGAPGTVSPASNPPVPGSAEHDPIALIGSWTLTEVGEDGGAVVEIGLDRLSVRRACGVLTGTWRADTTGLFVAYLYGSSGCPLSTEATPPWLRSATSFRVDGASRVLLDAQGGVAARLLPEARRSSASDGASSKAQPPAVADDVRRTFGPADPLPRHLAPAGRDALIGRWVPVPDGRAGGRDRPYLELHADGAWRGSDGCNGQAGRWVSGPAGVLLAVGGPSTLVGCDAVPVGGWLGRARRAGLDGQLLVLVDAHGKEIGRLQRA